MKTTLIVQTSHTADYTIRTETVNGKEHIVVPVVMMLEGVHAGSGGPLLHTESHLSQATGAWNGIPIVVRHPQDAQGNFISANSPQLASSHVGTIFNTRFEDGKLKADAYIDVQKLAANSATALEYIQNNRPMDVSVGVFNAIDFTEGNWNGEAYIGVASNYRPDHLALLPDEEGACNWNDGCGLRVNSSNNNKNNTKHEKIMDLNVHKELNKNGEAVVPIVNTLSLDGVLSAIHHHVNSLDNDVRVAFVEEAYEDHFIYRVRNRDTGKATLYRQFYSVNDKDELTLNGDAGEVRRNVSYETLQQVQRTKFNTNKNNVMDAKITARVDELINANGRFVECDRTWLSALSLENLAKLEAKPTTVKETVSVPASLDVNTAIDFLKKNAPQKDSILSLLSAEDKQAYEAGIAAYTKQREDFVAVVTNASKEWTKEELDAMDFNTLGKLAKSLTPAGAAGATPEKVDYSGLGAGSPAVVTNTATDDNNFLPAVQAYASKK